MSESIIVKDWQTKDLAEIFSELKASSTGLDSSEANERLQQYGPNKLPAAKVDSLLIIWLRQFQSPLIYILLAASFVVYLTGEVVDAAIILGVLLFNAVVGTIQEGRAQDTMLALNKFVETQATVLRDGRELIVLDSEVVPGDIIIVAEGEKIPADARLLLATNLTVDEAAMTGESKPVHKIAEALTVKGDDESNSLNVLFKGTHIVAGHGRAVVVATGLNTAVGKIAKEIAIGQTEIPLKTNIRDLSKLIIRAVAGISVVLFGLGLAVGNSAKEMFGTVVSLAVSVIPEGLPIVVTLILATGVWRMSKRQALVKKLQAVEALGQARIIAVDKTGTITKNELVIQKVYLPSNPSSGLGKIFDISGVGYEAKGNVSEAGKLVDPLNHPDLQMAGRIATLCADARVQFEETTNQWKVAGDPTEAAMLIFAQKLGINKNTLEQETPVIAEIPFDYKLKYHAAVQGGENSMLAVVGAPEVILNLSTKIRAGGQNHPLTTEARADLEAVYLNFSKEGLRVIALAMSHKAPKSLRPDDIKDLSFVGFFGMKDALRPEVAGAMAQAKAAGIKIVMITGDNKVTAETIAREAGIFQDGDVVISGSDVDGMSDSALAEKLATAKVFARVNPDHKLKIIKAYRQRGEIVAMTGDGVNDVPSLVAADLGVAMGKIGTEVAKEAADIILLDDNFGSIISAVEEGRSIYKTIKKVILYLFSTSLGEVLVIAGSLLLGLPLPVLPAQIIWLNFVTDGFLDVSLAMEPKDKNLLQSNFERPKKYLVDGLMIKRMIFMALPMAVGSLFVFSKYVDGDMTKAWTMCMTTLAVFQWFNAWNCRSDYKSVFSINPFSNKFLIAATFIVIILQLAAVYTMPLQAILHTTALAWSDWLIILPVAASIIVVEELRKFWQRQWGNNHLPKINKNLSPALPAI